MRDDDSAASGRIFIKRWLPAAMLMLASGLGSAQQTVTIGVEVEFVERIVVREAPSAASPLVSGATLPVAPDKNAYVVDVVATPGRELSIYSSAPVACAYGSVRRDLCDERALTAVTTAEAILVVSTSELTAAAVEQKQSIEITIAHH